MAEDGWLMLGAGETVIGQTTKLGADINARGLYRLIGDGSQVEKRAGRPASGRRRGLTARPLLCAIARVDLDFIEQAIAQFRRARSCRSR